MSKRKETLEIEELLNSIRQKQGWYGCEEVTIGFYHNGHGDEIVDYCMMDRLGTIRCYEIKVTFADLKSKAKKSWYGHYNYLFVTCELYEKIKDNLDKYIPDYCLSAAQYDDVMERINTDYYVVNTTDALMYQYMDSHPEKYKCVINCGQHKLYQKLMKERT